MNYLLCFYTIFFYFGPVSNDEYSFWIISILKIRINREPIVSVNTDIAQNLKKTEFANSKVKSQKRM